MPDPIQAPQGTEQKLVFRTEDERQKAMDAIPQEPPMGTTDIDGWRVQQDAQQDALESATIDPNYVQGQPAQPGPAREAPVTPLDPAANQGDWYKPSEWTFQQNGQTITIGKDEIPEELRSKGIGSAKDLILDYVSTHRYAETKKQEYQQSVSDLQRQLAETQQKIKDYDKKLEDLSKRPATPEQPGAAAASVHSETEIDTLQTELNTVTEQLEKVDEDDPEFKSLSRSAIRIQARLTAMKDKAYNARFQAFDQEREQVKRDSEANKRRQDAEDAARAAEQKRQERKANMARTIEGFANAPTSQLKLSKSFAEAEKEYEEWATDIAATYYHKPSNEVTAADAEIAVQHFLNRTPSLINQLTAQGKLQRTPADLRKYLINTELYMMMQGQELDSSSGQWKQNEWRLPDMETAYERWKRKKGLKFQDEVNAANRAEEELLRVINPPNIAEQVPASQGPQAQRDMSKLSLPQAESIMQDLEKKASMSGYGDLEEWIERKRRTAPGDKDVESYDRADETLMAVK